MEFDKYLREERIIELLESGIPLSSWQKTSAGDPEEVTDRCSHEKKASKSLRPL